MNQLHTVGARLGAVGRCALVGMLVGMLATQAVAEGAAVVTPKTSAKPETTNVPSGSLEQINLATTENLPLTSQDNADLNALPDAPTASTGSSDSASLTMPPELKAMMDDASKNSQNLQPAPASKPHGVQQPGMLTMGILGLPFMALGALFYVAAPSSKNAGAAVGVGSIFFVPGALMSGFGFHYAFKPRQ
ncbi:MAG: hypothetical protein ABSE36_19425 [Terracidiphilus sp.]|jgi:hypothetical protein